VLGSSRFALIVASCAVRAFGGERVIGSLSGLAVLGGLRRASSRIGGVIDSKRTEQFTSLLLFALIPVIGLGTVYSYVSGLKPEGSPLGIAIATGAVIVMPYPYIKKKRIGRETRSCAPSKEGIESI